MTAQEALVLHSCLLVEANLLKALDGGLGSREYQAYFQTWTAAQAVEELAAKYALDELRAAK